MRGNAAAAGGAAAEPSRVTGRRAARKPRINYLELLGDLIPENCDPNTPTSEQGQRRKSAAARSQGPAEDAAAAAAAELDQPRTAKVAGGKAKRKAVVSQEPQQDEAWPSSQAAAAWAAAGVARADTIGDDGTWEPEEGGVAGGKQRRKAKRQRMLVDVHRTVFPAELDPEECDTEYERARLERIRRNQEMLQQMGIRQMAQVLVTTCNQPAGAAVGGSSSERQARPRERRERVAVPLEPSRKSARMRGLDPSSSDQALHQLPTDASDKDVAKVEKDELLPLEEYFKLIGQDVRGALVVDGHYHGFVNPTICERYGMAGSAGEAWEAGGGGKFTFKIDKKAIPAHLRAKGWSEARAFAATMLKKNPNAYFYRHVAPHEQQAQGEWTEEEHELFLSTARANGVGDKWGLFASYIPQRVGYQCSAYYRDVIIPAGLILDNRFKMTRNGKAVFVG